MSSLQLVEESLAAVTALDGDLGAFVTTDATGALQAAAAADDAIAAGRDLGPLMGIPVAIKDIVDVAGQPTRCGSTTYPADPVDSDATVTARLRRAGAIIVGKTTAHELACGVYSAPASNPWNRDRLPGGSSGGSGAAVAAGVVAMAIGSDTGGSIRIPAAVCGVVGLKPTYGRVSRAGVEPLSWSLDHVGPIAATVEGCALTLEAIAGADARDHSASRLPVANVAATLLEGVAGLRLGVLAGPPIEPTQPAVAHAFAEATEVLRAAGAELIEIRIPELAYTLAAEFGIVGPEAAAYHRRRLRADPHLIDPDIRSLLVAGLMLPTEHYFKALEARRIISAALQRTFSDKRLDALLSPTLPATAAMKDQQQFEFAQVAEPVTAAYVRTTAPFNLSGLPALSVPAGFDGDELPIGLQIVAGPFEEAMALRVGACFEDSTQWSRRIPPINAKGAAA